METEKRDQRLELKMECEDTFYAQARSLVMVHPAAFHEAFPPRQVNNLYFDTLGLDSYNDHIEGSPERRKLRFRWYGENMRTTRGQLELKCKRERVGWKMILPVEADLNFHSLDWFDFQQTLGYTVQKAKDGLFYELLRVSRPLIINSYKREYFVSDDDHIRLTLDYNLRAFDQWFSSNPNLEYSLPMLNVLVIEFKCAVEYASQMADVLAEFPLRVHRNSKYVAALDSVFER